MFELRLLVPRRPGRDGQRCAGRARRAERLGRGRRRADRRRAGAVRRARHAAAQGRLAALARAGAVRRTRRPREEAARLLQAQDFFAGCTLLGIARGARAGLGAADAIAVRAGGDHARVLDRADLARAAGAGAAGDPARPGPGLRHRHASRPRACACAGSPSIRRAASAVLDYGCGSGILAIGAAKYGAARHRRGRHRRGRGASRPTTTPQANGVHAAAPACPNWRRAATRPCWPTSWPRR